MEARHPTGSNGFWIHHIHHVYFDDWWDVNVTAGLRRNLIKALKKVNFTLRILSSAQNMGVEGTSIMGQVLIKFQWFFKAKIGTWFVLSRTGSGWIK